jgi:putative spermidine/putrescine transport system substrate-binding protein
LINKRPILALSAAMALVLASCGSNGTPPAASSSGTDSGGTSGTQTSSAPQGGNLTWVSFGGKFQDDQIEAWQKPITDATGITFDNVSPYDNAQLAAMVQAGKTVWDVTTPGGTFASIHCGDLYEKLEPGVVNPDDFVDGSTAGDCSAPAYVFANIFSYDADADVFKNEVPTKIEDFFDTKKFPGKRVLYDSENVGYYEAALVADGVDPKDLYPLDLDRAFKKLDTIKDSIIFAPTLGAAGQALTDKQGVMTLLVTARTVTTALAGVNLVPVWDFTTYAPGVVTIAKGSPNVDLANKAIKAMLTKESAIKYAELTGTGPALKGISASDIKYDPVQAKFNAFDDTQERGTVIAQDTQWAAQNYDTLTKRWNEWKIG